MKKNEADMSNECLLGEYNLGLIFFPYEIEVVFVFPVLLLILLASLHVVEERLFLIPDSRIALEVGGVLLGCFLPCGCVFYFFLF